VINARKSEIAAPCHACGTPGHVRIFIAFAGANLEIDSCSTCAGDFASKLAQVAHIPRRFARLNSVLRKHGVGEVVSDDDMPSSEVRHG
jgi:hypothetical protein